MKRVSRAWMMGVAMAVATSWVMAATPIEQWTQKSGAQVWFAASPTIPIVDVRVDFDAGSRRDPSGQAGLAQAAALMSGKGVMASKGQPALDENQLGEAWADLGAEFDASASNDRLTFSLRTLSDPEWSDKAVALAARELGQPAWSQEIWQRERERWSATLKEMRTRPSVVAWYAYTKAVYGNHPYGAEVTPESLSGIDVDQMQSFWKRLVEPCRAKVSVVGALDRDQADKLVERLLAQLPASDDCVSLSPVNDVVPLMAPREIRIPFQSEQTHVLMGQPGYKRNDPAFFALLVGNQILGGGGFTSRLMHEVREKRGLSYSVSSDFSPGEHAGAFTIALQTRPDQADEAIKVANQVLKDFVADGPTNDEIKAAKDNLIGSFPLRLDSNRKLLANVANIAWNDLPLDYLEHWTERVNAVLADEIQVAFQRVLQPDREITVVVGPEAE